MATWAPVYRFAWALEIKSTPPMYWATTDLMEDAAAFALGQFYRKRIKSADAVLSQSLSHIFYGVGVPAAITLALDNSDLAFNPALDWRLIGCVLRHYDRETHAIVVDFEGTIVKADFVNSEVQLEISNSDPGLMETLLPVAVINPKVGSPFETAGPSSAPIPVVFGVDVPLRPPTIAVDSVSDPGGNDYAVGYGNLGVSALLQVIDRDLGTLEKMGTWVDAPGAQAYVSTTRFSVGTGDHSSRYAAGSMLRCKTSASPADFLYTSIVLYDATTTPDQVQVADAILDAGIADTQINGEYFVIRAGYASITAGLLPQPAAAVNLTAVRLFGAEDAGFLAIVRNNDPNASNVHKVIEAILTNVTWGLSQHTAQTIDATSFNGAGLSLQAVGLAGAIHGALGYDQQQRRAGDVLDELLMMRGGRLLLNGDNQWELAFDFDIDPAPQQSFYLGPGAVADQAIKIKRITKNGRVSVGNATRNVILHWSVLGRTQAGTQKFTPREYARTSTAASTGRGQDLHIFSQWIRDQTIAELVVFYIAEKLKGADEELEFETGVEARDVVLGMRLGVSVPGDGISGNWQVVGIDKTLTDVSIRCIRLNANAYATPTGVIVSEDVSDTDVHTLPGDGSNLIDNPDFSPPTNGVDISTPHDWQLFPTSGGFGTSLPAWTITDHNMDYSAALLPGTWGGHYWRVTWASVPTVPAIGPDAPPGIITSMFNVHDGVHDLCLISIYCDQPDGVFIAIDEIKYSGITTHTPKLLPVVYDPTDTNGNGWGRYYARIRLRPVTSHVVVLFGVNKSGTFQFDGADFRIAGRSIRRPPPWARHKAPPYRLIAAATLDFSISNTATNLIPAGAHVAGVYTRVIATIVRGAGCTGFSVGTAIAATAWGTNITNTVVDTLTTAVNFTAANTTYYPTPTDVVIAGVGGTITSGKLRVEVRYTLEQPASGE